MLQTTLFRKCHAEPAKKDSTMHVCTNGSVAVITAAVLSAETSFDHKPSFVLTCFYCVSNAHMNHKLAVAHSSCRHSELGCASTATSINA